MAERVGKTVFDDHVSIELAPGRWTDTFVLPVKHDRALPPWDYAKVVRTVVKPLSRLRRGASLWVPVSDPGRWYFEEVKHTLRDLPMPAAVTLGRDRLPGLSDFSKIPPLYDVPCRGGVPAEEPNAFRLSDHALACLFVMTRLVAAYTSEVASGCLISDTTCRAVLWELEKAGYVEYHKCDPYIDSHLISVQRLASQGAKNRKDEEPRPYWRIRRPGLSAALRAWGVPPEAEFGRRTERNGLLDSTHRRRSRQWPAWLRKALPHADIYAGWSEVGISELRTNPDALAWGKMHGVETLFWLEVESGKSSRKLILDKTVTRWLKATGYAKAVEVHLVFVFLAMPWVREAARLAFTDVPSHSAVVVADWSRSNFGQLPYSKWGEVVFE